jgi:hypothetical protein
MSKHARSRAALATVLITVTLAACGTPSTTPGRPDDATSVGNAGVAAFRLADLRAEAETEWARLEHLRPPGFTTYHATVVPDRIVESALAEETRLRSGEADELYRLLQRAR